ncbi:TetR family transcriptional regulator [Bradyrhizobium sp. USDA 4353]
MLGGLEYQGRRVDAAFVAFVSQGYFTMGMLEIRNKASVSAGAMAHHFPLKHDLNLAVIQDRVARAVTEAWIAPFAS